MRGCFSPVIVRIISWISRREVRESRCGQGCRAHFAYILLRVLHDRDLALCGLRPCAVYPAAESVRAVVLKAARVAGRRPGNFGIAFMGERTWSYEMLA